MGDTLTPAERSPETTVIVVNWNGKRVLARCLDALEAQHYQDFEVILVDNGSTDDSLRLADNRALALTVLRLDSNRGFAPANNIAAQTAKGRWLALLNNDAYPDPDWLQALVDTAKARPEYAGFGSLQLDAHDPSILDGIGDVYHCSGFAWRGGHGQQVHAHTLEAREIFAPCAAAALYSRQAFLDAGGFDEDYFCYFEDVDLAYRLRLQGEKFQFVPQAVVHHEGSATTGRKSAFSRYHGHRNMLWTFWKNTPLWRLAACLPLHILVNLAFFAQLILRGEPTAPILRAWRDALLAAPVLLNKRRQAQQRRTVSLRALKGSMATGITSLRRRSIAP